MTISMRSEGIYKSLFGTPELNGIWRRKAEARVLSSVTALLLFCKHET